MAFRPAQLNGARLLHLPDYPRTRKFMEGLDHSNALAGQSPVFVWSLQTGSGNAAGVRRRPGHLDYCASSALPNAFWFGKRFPAPCAEAAPI